VDHKTAELLARKRADDRKREQRDWVLKPESKHLEDAKRRLAAVAHDPEKLRTEFNRQIAKADQRKARKLTRLEIAERQAKRVVGDADAAASALRRAAIDTALYDRWRSAKAPRIALELATARIVGRLSGDQFAFLLWIVARAGLRGAGELADGRRYIVLDGRDLDREFYGQVYDGEGLNLQRSRSGETWLHTVLPRCRAAFAGAGLEIGGKVVALPSDLFLEKIAGVRCLTFRMPPALADLLPADRARKLTKAAERADLYFRVTVPALVGAPCLSALRLYVLASAHRNRQFRQWSMTPADIREWLCVDPGTKPDAIERMIERALKENHWDDDMRLQWSPVRAKGKQIVSYEFEVVAESCDIRTIVAEGCQRGGTAQARFGTFKCIERQRERLKRNQARVTRSQVWFDAWCGGPKWSMGLFDEKLNSAVAAMKEAEKPAPADTSRRDVEINGYRRRPDGLIYRP